MNETATAALVAASGGLGAFLGATVTTLLNFRTQDRAQRRDQLRRDAETLGPIREYLQLSVSPERLAVNAPADDKQVSELYNQLVAQRALHTSAVQVLAFGHPDAGVRAVAQGFATELYNAVHSAGWVLREPLRDGKLLDAAREDHRKAVELLDELYELTTAYGDG